MVLNVFIGGLAAPAGHSLTSCGSKMLPHGVAQLPRAPGEQDRGGGVRLRPREVQSLFQGHSSSSGLRTFKDPAKISENLKYLLATKWEKKTVKSKLINVKCLQNVTLGQLH